MGSVTIFGTQPHIPFLHATNRKPMFNLLTSPQSSHTLSVGYFRHTVIGTGHRLVSEKAYVVMVSIPAAAKAQQ